MSIRRVAQRLHRKIDREFQAFVMRNCLMPMSVMDVRKMWVAVAQRRVFMFVDVGLGSAPLERMFMLMMLVMHVAMSMLERFMLMLVGVTFLEVNPYPRPINSEAAQNVSVTGSSSSRMAIAAPRKGAVEK